MRLMSKYEEAPTWWYLGLFAIMLALGLYTVLVYPTQASRWAFLLAVAISYGFALPIGIIEALTNNQIGLNVLTEFIYRYIQPGRPLALMIFKNVGYITMLAPFCLHHLAGGTYIAPATSLTMRSPPFFTFFPQVASASLRLGPQVRPLHENTPAHHVLCSGHRRHAVVLRPDRRPQPRPQQHQKYLRQPTARSLHLSRRPRLFLGLCHLGPYWSGPHVLYRPHLLGPFSLLYPGSCDSRRHLLWRASPSPVAAQTHDGTARLRRRRCHPARHPAELLCLGLCRVRLPVLDQKPPLCPVDRLNFLALCALDLGLALGTLFIFFAFTMQGIQPPRWWGNDVVSATMNVQGSAVEVRLSEGQTFGPPSWQGYIVMLRVGDGHAQGFAKPRHVEEYNLSRYIVGQKMHPDPFPTASL